MTQNNLSVDELHLRLSPAIVRAYLKNDFQLFLRETQDIPDNTFLCFLMIDHFEAMENLLGLVDNDNCFLHERILLENQDAYNRCYPAVIKLTQSGIYARQLRLFIRKNRLKETPSMYTANVAKEPSLLSFIKKFYLEIADMFLQITSICITVLLVCIILMLNFVMLSIDRKRISEDHIEEILEKIKEIKNVS
jgi:hypothetical protein